MDKTKYEFTNTWFENTTRGYWENLIPIINPENYLEIGAYEGASICFIIDKIAPKHPITIYAVDTWEGGVEHNKDEMPEVEKRFDKNLATISSLFPGQVDLRKYKDYSDQAMIDMLSKDRLYKFFDLIYIDGSHLASDILSDAVLAFKLLKVGGYMIFDDYYWRMRLQDGRILHNSFGKLSIDSFINVYFDKIEVVFSSPEQFAFRKIKE